MVERGRLIVLEGGEGSGKSTQAAILADRLGAVLTREPGGTRLGERVRALLLERVADPVPVCGRAELFLVGAARAQHVEEVLLPALGAGRDVVCDRFSGSTLAYQGFGRGLALDEVEAVSQLASSGLEADLTVLLDLPEDLAAARRPEPADRIEGAGAEFHQRVSEGFRSLAEDDPTGWVVVDATGSREEVAGRVMAEVATRLPGAGGLSRSTRSSRIEQATGCIK